MCPTNKNFPISQTDFLNPVPSRGLYGVDTMTRSSARPLSLIRNHPDFRVITRLFVRRSALHSWIYSLYASIDRIGADYSFIPRCLRCIMTHLSDRLAYETICIGPLRNPLWSQSLQFLRHSLLLKHGRTLIFPVGHIFPNSAMISMRFERIDSDFSFFYQKLMTEAIELDKLYCSKAIVLQFRSIISIETRPNVIMCCGMPTFIQPSIFHPTASVSSFNYLPLSSTFKN